MGESLSTTISPYRTLIVSAAGAETDLIAATGYVVGVPTPGGTLNPLDTRQVAGEQGGNESGINGVSLTCFATSSDNDDVTQSVYGIAEDGAPERVGSLLWTFGAAIRSAGVRWADSCVVTGTHITTIKVSDSGNDRIAKVSFDISGYRWLYIIAHTTTTGSPTGITVQYRYF